MRPDRLAGLDLSGIGRHLIRALCLVSGAALAHETVPARSPAAVMDPRIAQHASMQQRTQLLRRAEAELARGDTSAAIDSFDRAAMMLHSADTEMGLVRAYLQAGEYRRALAFSAHTAGAHREAAAPAALYAWLLQAGGQGDFATRILAEARRRHPADPVLAQAQQQLASNEPTAAGLLRGAPHRLAPYAAMQGMQAPVPITGRTVSSGVLIDAGRRALVPLSAVLNATHLWVRNGLGQTTHAELERRIDDLGVAVLRLPLPLDMGEGWVAAPRDPFAGSPGFVVEFAAAPGAAPAWPWLQTGFHGLAGDAGLRRLGIAVPAGSTGGLVLDAAGRFAGIALTGSDGQPALLPISRLREALPDSMPEPDGRPPTAGRMPADEAYERALRVALQVIVMP